MRYDSRMSAEPVPPRHQAPDTDPWVERMMFDHWRGLEPLEKAELVSDLCRSLFELSLAGLRSRHPEATEHELEHMAARLRLGDELYERFIAVSERP